MARDLSCRLVFLASPGGLSEEREACRDEIDAFHRRQSLTTGVTFLAHAWEDVPGGVGRPQDLINPLLDKSDYLLVLLGDQWGSPPSQGGTFSSGTEEEIFRTLDLLADEGQPMRDILVLFKTIDPARLRDPGDKLKPVLAFRARLEASKQVMYETFDSIESLRKSVASKLHQWAAPLEDKVPTRIDLPKMQAGPLVPSGLDPNELLDAARKFATQGMLVSAETAYSMAIAEDDPQATLEFAKLMRRSGRVERALELNEQVLRLGSTLLSVMPGAVAARTDAMANIGVIQRKRGKLVQSARSLREAVETADGSGVEVPDSLCYALDNYGFTLLALGRLAEAALQFQRAYDVRQTMDDDSGIAQSAVNLGRLRLAQGSFASAATLFREGLGKSAVGADDHLRANALAGAAEAYLRVGEMDEAAPMIAESLQLNEKLQNSDGLSITHALNAQVLIFQDNWDEASIAIDKAEDEVARTGNPSGRAVVTWLRGEISRGRGDTAAALDQLSEAEALAQSAGDPALQDRIQVSLAAVRAR